MDIFFNTESMEAFIYGLGIWGFLVFFLLQVLQSIIAPLPGNILTMVGGVVFGLWPGFFLAFAGNVVGSIIGFLLVRWGGRKLALKLMGPARVEKYMKMTGTEDATEASPRTKTVFAVVLFFPFAPSDFMCLFMGLTPISLKAFILIVLLFRPWGQLGAAIMGIYAVSLPVAILIPAIIALILLCVAAIYYAPRLEQFIMRLANSLTRKPPKA